MDTSISLYGPPYLLSFKPGQISKKITSQFVKLVLLHKQLCACGSIQSCSSLHDVLQLLEKQWCEQGITYQMISKLLLIAFLAVIISSVFPSPT